MTASEKADQWLRNGHADMHKDLVTLLSDHARAAQERMRERAAIAAGFRGQTDVADAIRSLPLEEE